ncbi:hypothetical protein, partial [Clostridium sp. YIM B02555]|uniref:hypothetical protein n=1 Tax=Clostridium sp. YIM B02555 TaxID=2911968 RepID=UPI001EECF5CA
PLWVVPLSACHKFTLGTCRNGCNLTLKTHPAKISLVRCNKYVFNFGKFRICLILALDIYNKIVLVIDLVFFSLMTAWHNFFSAKIMPSCHYIVTKL